MTAASGDACGAGVDVNDPWTGSGISGSCEVRTRKAIMLPPVVPVTVLTGFLGSGKTTLLARLLADPALADTAVIINEFGEVGLDHHLLERLEGETVLLDGGCVCCSVRDGLVATLRGLLRRARTGEIPAFQRIVIETTGLADPGPVVATMLSDPDLAAALAVTAVVTTVDSVTALDHLDRHLESVQQVAVADRLVLTKGDLAHPAVVRRLRERLCELNPHAEVLTAVDGAAPAQVLLAPARPVPPQLQVSHSAHQCNEQCADLQLPGRHPHAHQHGPHDARVRSHVFTFDTPLQWEEVSHWLGSVAFFHGDKVLRMKGLLALDGERCPVAVHGVRHLVHEPVTLREWQDEDHRSHIVFITCDLGREPLEAALRRAQVDTQGESQPRLLPTGVASPPTRNSARASGTLLE